MPFMSSYRKRSATKRSRKTPLSSAKRTAKSVKPVKMSVAGVRSIAKSVLHRTAENKLYVQSLTLPSNVPGSGIDWNGTTGSNGLLLPTLFPQLILGSGQGAREGNKVEPRSFMLRGTINSLPYLNQIPNVPAPYYVHMFIYRKKGNIFDSDITKILQGGGSAGSSGPFDGTLLKSTYPMNRDLYNVYKHRVFKMAFYPQGTLVGAPSGNNTEISDGWGNGFQMCRTFKVRIPVRKTWKYNDADTNLPTNDNFFCAFAVVNADNTINAPLVSRCQINCESVLNFEDV